MSEVKRLIALGAVALLGLTGCGERGAPEATDDVAAEAANAAAGETSGEAPAASAAWQLLSSGEGTALRLAGESGIHMFCPSRSGRLIVNVAGFEPIASEERLSLGSGGTVVALVADSKGDSLRGGVSGEAPVPGELGDILSGPISASYGAQKTGPLSPPNAADRAAFLTACGEKASPPTPVLPKPAAPTAACFIQDGAKLAMAPLRAIGTEPFWGARIEGRCVTYSTPENQAGTRIWTKYSGTADAGTWGGALDGRQFELRTTKQAGCSDGMSDNRYPVAVTLRVRGETRRGCAKPL